MVEAVLFDLWNTLAYSDPKEHKRSESDIFEFLRLRNVRVKLDDYRKLREKYYMEVVKGRLSSSEANRLILRDFGIDESNLFEFNRRTQNFFERNMRLFGGVKEVLNRLRDEGLKLGLVTNCGDDIGNLLRQLTLENYFDSYGLSNEVGVQKPDPRIYMKVVDELSVKPEDCVFVTDELSDSNGAKKLGMKTILVKETRCWRASDVKSEGDDILPDASVDQIIDVLNIIRGWSHG
jgi:putative hydrolase of the HAD superfamily